MLEIFSQNFFISLPCRPSSHKPPRHKGKEGGNMGWLLPLSIPFKVINTDK